MNIFLALLLSLYGVITANAVCTDVIVDSTTTTYVCDSPGSFDATYLPTMPTNSKIIFISGEVRVNNYCGRTGPYHFGGLTIEPTTGTPYNIVDLSFVSSVTPPQVLFQTQDVTNGVITPYGLSNSFTFLGQWIAFYVWINLDTNVANGYFALPGSPGNLPPATPSFPSTWTFDASPKLYLCSEPGGTNSLSCDFTNVRVVYSIPNAGSNYQLVAGLQSKLVASYAMTQTSGYTITDSGSLGTAYLGSSTAGVPDTDTTHMPTWEQYIDSSTNKPNQDQGLTFTASTQYVSVPHFSLPPALQVGGYSIGIRVWLKLPSSLTADGYIFTYSTSDLSTMIFAVQLVSSTSRLKIITYGSSAAGTVALNHGQWNSIIVYLQIGTYLTGAKFNFATSIVNNANDLMSSLILPSTAFSQSNTDVIRIGGPPTVLGTMAGFEIYSPASSLLPTASGCSASTCNREVGANTLSNSICALPICSTNCVACLNSQVSSCLGCNTGYVYYNNQCQLTSSLTCPAGKYMDSSFVCQNCPSHCDVCSGGSTCTTCSSTYILSNNQCVSPSSGSSGSSGSVSTETSRSNSSSLSSGAIVGIVIGSIAAVSIVAGVVYGFMKYKSRKRALMVAQGSPTKVTISPTN